MSNSILPIREREDELKEALLNNRVVVIAGETGSGKTTQLPQMCRELGFAKKGKIAVTQPRRIAATATAKRVAQEINSPLGETVGYKIRFAEKLSANTEIQFMTDGMLLSEMSSNRDFSGYSTIIVDEAHERSLNIDFILGYLRKLIKARDDLRVIISSATIDTELFSKAFDNAPIIEVSGRMFPVEIIYDPIEKGDGYYIDKVVSATNEIIEAEMGGDILIFMPTERDILETVDKLKGRRFYNTTVLPLFARLTRFQQNRIFEDTDERKIVVSTNVAETSLTIPGVRFVIDTGLARVSRYAPNLRTNRLPIEDISQAEAMQRSGRAGRVAKGLCIRLYSKKNFESRVLYRDAEIKRSNLAGVILSMMNMRLGDIEVFPFLEVPEKRAITDAFSQLYELSAVNSKRKLTPRGRAMAKLPIEPHISRMILQGAREGVVNEVAIIAAALSVIDPRERPLDQQELADEVHKKFIDHRSDFLTLLKLWNAYYKQLLDLKTQNRMRRYCKEHFLSYNRMREWGDVHKQITNIMKQSKIRGNTSFSEKSDGALVHGIHKSIFSGLLSNMAMYDPEEKIYRATRNRAVTIFPGSVLTQKRKRPNWIMAQEIVETSRVWARAVGPVDPHWTEEFVPHLLKRNYGVPYYDIERGTVLAEEKLLFSGLLVSQGRKKFYGGVNIKVAKEIFIRKALVEGEARDKLKFVAQNMKLYESIVEEEAKIRDNGFLISEEKIYEIYSSKLPSIASVKEVLGFIKKNGVKDLLFSREILIENELPQKTDQFPSKYRVGEKSFDLNYSYSPGKENDGITVTIPLGEVAFIHSSTFEWLVEPLWEEKIACLLKSLPKSERKQFVPVTESAKKIRANLKFQPLSFNEALSLAIKATYGVNISPKSFSEDKLPEYLKMRISVVDRKGKIIKSDRDIQSLKDINSSSNSKSSSDISKIIKRNEVRDIESWSFNDLPIQKELSKSNDGFSLFGFTALAKDGKSLKISYLTNRDEAIKVHRDGIGALILKLLAKDLDWLERDLKFSKELKLLSSPYGGELVIKKRVFEIIRDEISFVGCNPPYKKSDFNNLLNEKQEILRGAGYRSLEILKSLFRGQSENRDIIKRALKKSSRKSIVTLASELQEEVDIYMEQFISGIFPYSLFVRLPKIIESLSLRIEKAFNSPVKYNENNEKLLYYQNKFAELAEKWDLLDCPLQSEITKYQLMIEEFSISLFGHPKIKPLYKVSEKSLSIIIEQIENSNLS